MRGRMEAALSLASLGSSLSAGSAAGSDLMLGKAALQQASSSCWGSRQMLLFQGLGERYANRDEANQCMQRKGQIPFLWEKKISLTRQHTDRYKLQQEYCVSDFCKAQKNEIKYNHPQREKNIFQLFHQVARLRQVYFQYQIECIIHIIQYRPRKVTHTTWILKQRNES